MEILLQNICIDKTCTEKSKTNLLSLWVLETHLGFLDKEKCLV